MGPALSMRSKQLAGQTAGYASVAGNAEMQRIHNKHEGLFNSQGAPSAADIDKCPHASAARRAAELARAMADAKVAKAAAPAPAAGRHGALQRAEAGPQVVLRGRDRARGRVPHECRELRQRERSLVRARARPGASW